MSETAVKQCRKPTGFPLCFSWGFLMTKIGCTEVFKKLAQKLGFFVKWSKLLNRSE